MNLKMTNQDLSIRNDARVFLLCAKHGTNLASESLATGIYRQV